MSADPTTFVPTASGIGALVEAIARFHIRDKAMLRAQAEIGKTLAATPNPAPASVARYISAVERYFAGFEEEARSHLADIDRRLARAAQLQFNLTAERNVTTKRIEITQGVLTQARELARS